MNDLVNGLLDLFISIFTIITNPFQELINKNFPSLNDFADQVADFFSLINSTWIPWIKDLTFLPQWTFDLILGYLLFIFACSIAVNIVKLIIKYWYFLVP